MEFNPEAVEFFVCDPARIGAGKADVLAQMKCRMCIGFVIGDQFYHMQKMGAMWPVLPMDPGARDRMIQASERTYNNIPDQGEIKLPIFGYDLGMPVEYDDDGEPIGEWPKLGELVLQYQEKILMPRGALPSRYEHLQLVRLGWS